MSSATSVRTAAVVLIAVAFLLRMQGQMDMMPSHSQAFGQSSEFHRPLSSDLNEIDQQILERKARIANLEQANEDLKRQQDSLLAQAQGGVQPSHPTMLRPAEPASLSRQLQPAAAAAVPRAPVRSAPMTTFQPPPLPSAPAQPRPQRTAPAPAAPQIRSTPGTIILRNERLGGYLTVNTDRGNDYGWLMSNGDENTNLRLRAFQVVPQSGGWVGLKSLATDRFLEMVPQNQPLAWVLRATSTTLNPPQLFQIEGNRVKNQATGAYVNIITDGQNAVRGHGNSPNKKHGAGQEPTTAFQITDVSTNDMRANVEKMNQIAQMERQIEQDYIDQINASPRFYESVPFGGWLAGCWLLAG